MIFTFTVRHMYIVVGNNDSVSKAQTESVLVPVPLRYCNVWNNRKQNGIKWNTHNSCSKKKYFQYIILSWIHSGGQIYANNVKPNSTKTKERNPNLRRRRRHIWKETCFSPPKTCHSVFHVISICIHRQTHIQHAQCCNVLGGERAIVFLKNKRHDIDTTILMKVIFNYLRLLFICSTNSCVSVYAFSATLWDACQFWKHIDNQWQFAFVLSHFVFCDSLNESDCCLFDGSLSRKNRRNFVISMNS